MQKLLVTGSTVAILGGLLSLLLQLPVNAGPINWFDRWDYNHNGCRSWPEFIDSNMYWYAHNPQENRLGGRELHRQYNAIAAAHGGRVHLADVQYFHHWE